MLVFWLSTFICKIAFFLVIAANHLTGIIGGPLLFLLNGIFSCCQSRVFFFLSHSCLLFLQLDLASLLVQGRVGALPSTCFAVLGLDSLLRGLLVVGFLVYIFEKVLWNRHLFLGQYVSKSRTIILDLRPALASVLIALCIIFSKLVDVLSCYFISTLMKGLRPS